MKYSENGAVTVRVFTAGGALPVPNTVVHISGADENNRFVEYTVLTDLDGLTQKINLPAPNKSYSLAPGAEEVPYSVYDIEITSDGYYTKTIRNVAVFSGTNSFQEVNMIPMSPIENELYPRGNLNPTVFENEYLEL